MDIKAILRLLTNLNEQYLKVWDKEEVLEYWGQVSNHFGELMEEKDTELMKNSLVELEVVNAILKRVKSEELIKETVKERDSYIQTINKIAEKYMNLYD